MFAIDQDDPTPLYAQLERAIRVAIATGRLKASDRLPTVRQLAVDLAINPNTVLRAYRELELGGLLETQQGTGTFITSKKPEKSQVERERQLNQLAGEFLSRAGAGGFTAEELLKQLRDLVERK